MGYVGIDYGLIGQTNRDAQTGIHYGVISQNSVGQAWYEDSEPDYGEPTCPKCGREILDSGDDAIPPTEQREHWDYKGNDFACIVCESTFWSDAVYGDEPLGYSYEGEGYKLSSCFDSDIFVLDSPYYTFAQFCSPCVPGAGNLDNAMEEGIKTYCLGHDWFEEGKAPYPVYSVESGELIAA